MSYKKILAGVDGSNTSLIALRSAARLAKTLGAELIAVCAFTPPDPQTLERWRKETPGELSWRMSQTAAADEALERAREVAAKEGVDITKRTEEGEPADVILDLADQEDVGLIVVGSVGLTGAKRFLLGSVPNKISHHAPCDVLIVKTA